MPRSPAPEQSANRSTSVHSLHDRWRPRAVEDGGLGPVGADVKRELVLWRRHPIRLPVGTGRRVLVIQRERAVGVVFERLALCAEGEPGELVRLEQMFLVVEGQ